VWPLSEGTSVQGVIAGLGYCDTSFVLAAGRVFQDNAIPFVTRERPILNCLCAWETDCFMTAFETTIRPGHGRVRTEALNVKKLSLWTDESPIYTRLLSCTFGGATSRGWDCGVDGLLQTRTKGPVRG